MSIQDKRMTIIQTALAEVSDEPKETGDNMTSYNRDFVTVLTSEGVPKSKTNEYIRCSWCGIFVWWVFNRSGLISCLPQTETVDYAWTPGFKSLFKNPIKNSLSGVEPGDLVFFYYPSEGRIAHVGIVYEITGGSSFKTIEGNTSKTGDKRSLYVSIRNRSIGSNAIYFCKPNYGNDPAIPPVGDTSFDLPSGHYYGNRPSSSNCHSGRIAADKEAVKMIQRMVGVNADGIFGSGTEEAVKRWQSAHGLTADGMVGKNTWNAMFNGSSSGSTSTTFPLPSGHYFGNRPSSSNCHSGRIASDKQYVRMIQNKVGVSADGIFGSGTESAVKTWQSNHGLTADGMVGQGTWKAMFS